MISLVTDHTELTFIISNFIGAQSTRKFDYHLEGYLIIKIVAQSNNNNYTNNNNKKIVTAKINEVDNNMDVMYKCQNSIKPFHNRHARWSEKDQKHRT